MPRAWSDPSGGKSSGPNFVPHGGKEFSLLDGLRGEILGQAGKAEDSALPEQRSRVPGQLVVHDAARKGGGPWLRVWMGDREAGAAPQGTRQRRPVRTENCTMRAGPSICASIPIRVALTKVVERSPRTFQSAAARSAGHTGRPVSRQCFHRSRSILGAVPPVPGIATLFAMARASPRHGNRTPSRTGSTNRKKSYPLEVGQHGRSQRSSFP